MKLQWITTKTLSSKSPELLKDLQKTYVATYPNLEISLCKFCVSLSVTSGIY